jgi:hypothetical protein
MVGTTASQFIVVVVGVAQHVAVRVNGPGRHLVDALVAVPFFAFDSGNAVLLKIDQLCTASPLTILARIK